MFWANTFVLVYLIENPAWRLGHNRLQFYFLKCWHLSKCSHGMFAWFVDWHFLFVTCLTKKEPCRPSSTVLTGSRPLLAAETFLKFLFYFPLPLHHSALAVFLFWHAQYHSSSSHLTIEDIPERIKISHLGSVQKFSVL